MPHKLVELNEMSREQLEKIANDLQIKTKKLSEEQIAYAILDAEAQAESVKVEEKPRRRGRPEKANSSHRQPRPKPRRP